MTRAEFYSNLMNYQKVQNDPDAETIKHYGIIGQKWGQRRWQNADGTFNTEGKIRYFGSQKAQAEKMQNEKVGGIWDHPDGQLHYSVNGVRAGEANYVTNKFKSRFGDIDDVKTKDDYDKAVKLLEDQYEEEVRRSFSDRDYYSEHQDRATEYRKQLEALDDRFGSQPGKVGGLFGKKGNDIGTGEHLREIHELRRQIDEFEDAGLDTKSLEKMLKYYENADGYKYGSKPGADEKKKIMNDTIKGLFSKKKDNLPDKIREQAKKLREVGEDELADKYEKHAKDMEACRKIGHAPGATEQEIKEARRAAANAYATAFRNKWPLFFLFGPIGGAIIGSIASNAKVNKIIDQLGLDRMDKDKFTASDWNAINEAIKESRRKKPKNQSAE